MRSFKWGAIAALMVLLGWGMMRLPERSPPPVVSTPPVRIPDEILPCLPPSSRRDLKAWLQSGPTRYYVIGSYQPQYRQFLIASPHQGRCQNLIPESGLLPDNFLSAYVSRELAQQLTLKLYQQAIQELGGSAQFQQQFRATAAQLSDRHPGYLSPEQGWALQQLGIQVPPQIRIVSIDQYRRRLTRSPQKLL